MALHHPLHHSASGTSHPRSTSDRKNSTTGAAAPRATIDLECAAETALFLYDITGIGTARRQECGLVPRADDDAANGCAALIDRAP